MIGSLHMYNSLLTNLRERRELFLDRIEDGSPVEWYSALRMYKIVFSREESQMLYLPDRFHYIISMDVTDNIGVPVLSIKFTEFDIVELISDYTSWLYDIYEFGERECKPFEIIRNKKSIGSFTDTISIEISTVPDLPVEVPFGESLLFNDTYQEMRDMKLTIYYYNKFNQTMVKALQIPISPTESLDILDCLFCTVADIELPTDQQDLLTNILESLMM